MLCQHHLAKLFGSIFQVVLVALLWYMTGTLYMPKGKQVICKMVLQDLILLQQYTNWFLFVRFPNLFSYVSVSIHQYCKMAKLYQKLRKRYGMKFAFSYLAWAVYFHQGGDYCIRQHWIVSPPPLTWTV